MTIHQPPGPVVVSLLSFHALPSALPASCYWKKNCPGLMLGLKMQPPQSHSCRQNIIGATVLAAIFPSLALKCGNDVVDQLGPSAAPGNDL